MGCSPNKPLYSYDLTDNAYLKEFVPQYSYDMHLAPVNPMYFNATNDGLMLRIYPSDLPFKDGSDTYPRTELRGKTELNSSLYEVSFDYLLVNNSGTDYSFFQVFGKSSPTLMLRYRMGEYQVVLFDDKEKINNLSVKYSDMFNQWVNWKVVFKDGRYGFYAIYVNNKLIKRGDSRIKCDGGYLKYGIYCQQMKPNGLLESYIKNIKLSIY